MLAEPLAIGSYTARNRVVVPPMANFGLAKQGGAVTPEHIAHYEAYAAGGAGLVIVEASGVIPPGNTLGVYDDTCIPGLSGLACAISSHGAVTLVQLLHPGTRKLPEKEIAQISREDFLYYKTCFVNAAVRCRTAGFHGVELHAAHGFYLNEVVENNSRADEYGGSFENRIRLLQELIAEIKGQCGREFLVAVRFGDRNIQELLRIAAAIETAGGDLLDVSTGCGGYCGVPAQFAFDGKIYAASLVKGQTSLPVIGVGNLFTGAQAEAVLENGYADLAAVGRGRLCDPAWANKTFSGKAPVLCRNCSACMWYTDSSRCPAGKRNTKEETNETSV